MASSYSVIDKLEQYFVPTCFGIGLLGNFFGILTILTAKKLRKHTVFFILAIIGITDTILICSQMQRWLAIYYDHFLFIINNSLCKFYLMLVRSSVLISSSLVLTLTISSVIRLYLGAYRLSTTSKLGQLLSKLSILISILLSMSVSWHELWTSGLRSSSGPIHLNDYDEGGGGGGSDSGENDENGDDYSRNMNELKCSKNIESFMVIEIINFIYFFVSILINLSLVFNCMLIYSKLKQINLNGLSKSRAFNETTVRLVLKPSFQLRNYGTELIALPEHNTSNVSRDTNAPSSPETSNMNTNPKKFTRYLISISIISTMFSLPFILVDVAYYKDVLLINHSSNQTILNERTLTNSESLLRLPLIFLNVPHALKFYLLFAFSSKFRVQLSRLTRLRFYLDPSVLRRISLFSAPRSCTPSSQTHSSIFSRFNESSRRSNAKNREISSCIEPDLSTNATINQHTGSSQHQPTALYSTSFKSQRKSTG